MSSASTLPGNNIDLVMEGFRRLNYDFDGAPDRPASSISDFSIDRINIYKDDQNELKSGLLPLLRQQILTFLSALDPSALYEESDAHFEYILQIQSDLEDTLRDINSTVVAVRNMDLEDLSTNDQHLEVIKVFVLFTLEDKLNCIIFRYFGGFFGDCWLLFEELRLSGQDPSRSDRDIAGEPVQLAELKAETLAWIERLIEYVNRSDWDLVQLVWRDSPMESINQLLSRVQILINPIGTTANNDEHFISGARREPALRLAQSVISLMKLSRLLFDKLSTGYRVNRRSSFTNMCSNQLELLSGLSVSVELKLAPLPHLVKLAIGPSEAIVGPEVVQLVEGLLNRFQPSLLLIVSYVIPIIPDTNGLSTHTYLTAWLTDWNNTLHVAANNVIKAAKSFESHLV
ncbi:hypothetical protein Pst134EA_000602 [Puccinia striiformis f. sp. tritici]|uniref:hypothetical protein n=1 Tax=Puccinia striiformis f. sp. tritici TaxID=168172 RepID=UPI002008B706|nr:hypothetical protein Pst134EA_000602 [Puccinia striiformis f. sp. tritici]KAH9473523.1 hypothetical protein Pst134EA_000602 [Puccinia striiformis f. sp. tritici]